MSYGRGEWRGRRGGGRGFGDRGRGFGDRSRNKWSRGGGRGGGSRESSEDRSQGAGPRDRPPPHLKGREIGLWYAHRGGAKRKEMDRKARAVVQMDESREQHITKLLNSVQRGAADPRSDAHSSGDPRSASRTNSHCFFDGEEEPSEEVSHREIKDEEVEDEEEWPTQKAHSAPQRVFKQEDAPPVDSWEQREDSEARGNPRVLESRGNPRVLESGGNPRDLESGGNQRDLEYLFEDLVRDASLDQQLQRDLQTKRAEQKYRDMLKFREKLPSYGMKEELVGLINSSRVVVVSGETGCGKTTQVTQFILDDHIDRGMGSLCRVICTQPRRISAISVAERVSAERAETVGAGNSCGYQIRLQSRLPRKRGSVLYCTTGIILQWLRSDPLMSTISHLVLDEIHERTLHSDVLLIIVKDLLQTRPDLKVVLMSATLNADKFSQYFGNCPMIHIPGMTFPVQEFLLEDVVEMIRYRPQQNRKPQPRRKKGFMQGQASRPEKEQKEAEYEESWPAYSRSLRSRYSDSTIDVVDLMKDDDKIDLDLILQLIQHIVMSQEEGAILVFLPGWADISSLNDLLMAQQMFRSDRFVIIPLHSLMPTVTQTSVFQRPPPGVRKIVIATNIAETSITIDDVVYVIDGGKIKETHFDTNNNISTMQAEWVSLANAKQRRGRAGRVRPGKCYHLYDGLRASLLDPYQLPEIMRTPLEELCLQIKILELGAIAEFLSKALDAPTEQAVTLAITHLMDLNALDRCEALTPLGHHLARLPVEPHIGKLILFGALLACLDPVLTIAASLSFKDPFFIPLGKEKMADQRRRTLSRNSKSDHLTIVNAFMGWEEAKSRGSRFEREFCWENFLSANTLQMLHNMKGQFAEHLLGAGFISSKNPKDPASNINSDQEKLIKAVIVAGLYPKVAKITPSYSKKIQTRPPKVSTKAEGKVCIHPKSVNAEERDFNYTWLIYHLKMKTSNIFLYDCTEVSPLSLLFFGGDISIQRDREQETIAVDQWIVFQSPARIAHLVKSLRSELDSLLEQKIRRPVPVDWTNRQSKDCAVISAIVDLITTQEKHGASGPAHSGHGWSNPGYRGAYRNSQDEDDDDEY